MQDTWRISFGWRLPGGAQVKAVFDARAMAYDEARDRWLVRLIEPVSDLAGAPANLQAAIRALAGCWVYVPPQARQEITLPLKLETLTGRIRYFHSADPRLPAEAEPAAERAVQRRIAGDLLAAGLRRGGAVLVHSSLSSLGHVPGGPETVLRGLLDAVGPEGALLLPALSYEYANPAHPYFDVLNTPSNVGAIPEAFRVRLGTLRSVNPTHSVCGAGARAALMLGQHIQDETPCGAHSPFRLLREAGGQIVFLGCGLRPNTSMHAVEELVEPPYLFGPVATYQVTLASGEVVSLRCRRHNFAGYAQRYDRLAAVLRGDDLKTGPVLQATAHIVECASMWERAEAALRRDPLCFVEARAWNAGAPVLCVL